MNIGRSIRVALAQRDKKQAWLAIELGTSRQYICKIAKKKHSSGYLIEKLSATFGLSASEFIALGEQEAE